LLCYVYRSSLYCNIPSDLCNLVSVLLLLLHCFIFMLVLSLCCVYRSSLYCNIPLDLLKQCRSNKKTYTDYTSLKVCYSKVMIWIHNIATVQDSVFVLSLPLHCFIFIRVPLLCYVSRSSPYCNIPLDLCTQCLSCYYFYIVLSLYLYTTQV
jgi:hypothetical protein